MQTIKQMTDILLAALIVELRADGTDDICSFSKQPGDSVSLDYSDCGGMAWVRLISATPSASFPTPVTSVDNCAFERAYPLEIGVMRPAAIAQTRLAGSGVDLPTDDEVSASADAQMQDMDAMYRAIQRAKQDIGLVLVGSYTPVGPVGGTVGGTWSLTVGADD